MAPMSPTRPPDQTSGRALPLSLLRIWCRRSDAWLSFTTVAKDRYLISAKGYFVELQDGSLMPVSARMAFPVVDRLPSVRMSDLEEQSQFGPGIRFITVSDSGPRGGKPHGITLEDLSLDIQEGLPWRTELGPVEHYIALRVFESGLVPERDLLQAIGRINGQETLGQTLIGMGLCSWEPLVAVCLDTRAPTKLDPPAMKALANRKEWERIGEILIALGKINRTHLEQALKVQRDGQRALGEILDSMGACTEEDIQECLRLQREIRNMQGAGVALVGQLLVSQGVISPDALEEALRNQRVARYSLQRILISMGACTMRDIEDFARCNNWHHFQDEIDDIALGHWLVKVGTISRQQLDEALRVQVRGRQVLGELLISLKLCTQEDINSMLDLQKDIRRNHSTGVEKLGTLLVRKGKVDAMQLERALASQSLGRQPLGCILIAMDACSPDDVSVALDIQRRWREADHPQDDLLGEVLVRSGVLSRSALEAVLSTMGTSSKPLGRSLIEEDLCTPEQIIETLLGRDFKRHQEFLAHVRSSAPQVAEPLRQTTRKMTSEIEVTIMDKVSAWLTKRTGKV